MATTVKTPATKTAFPKAAVEKALLDGLVDGVTNEAMIKNYKIPEKVSDLIKASVYVDSLMTVDVLCNIEPVIGFELPQHVVKTGGYRSIESAVQHVLGRIEREWNKRHGVKT
jgi:hypothetical protein